MPWEANVCPYCGHDYRFQQYGKKQEISNGLRVVFYILSFLIWIAGLVLGLVYIMKQDEESKHVGKMCLVFMAIGLGLMYGLSFLLYIVILGWA